MKKNSKFIDDKFNNPSYSIVKKIKLSKKSLEYIYISEGLNFKVFEILMDAKCMIKIFIRQ